MYLFVTRQHALPSKHNVSSVTERTYWTETEQRGERERGLRREGVVRVRDWARRAKEGIKNTGI